MAPSTPAFARRSLLGRPAVSALRANPALKFAIAERVTERRTLSIASFDQGALIKSLIERVPGGYALVQPNARAFASLFDLLVSVFGQFAKQSSGDARGVMPRGGSMILSTNNLNSNNNPGSPMQRARAVTSANETLHTNNVATSNDGMKLTRRNSQEALNKPVVTFASVMAATATTPMAASWKSFVRLSKLQEIDPLHRDLDGSLLGDRPWYHFAMSGAQASKILLGLPIGSFLVRIGSSPTVGVWVRIELS